MAQTFDFGGCSFDLPLCIKLLKQDLKDDWFPDPIRYEECLKPDIIHAYLEENISSNHGSYKPESAEIFNVPKKGFLLRYALETNIYDRLIYVALINELLPYYDPLLSKNSFSHRRRDDSRSNNKYIFKNGIEQFKSFEGLIKEASSEGKTLLVTDVFNYFENIQIVQLRSCLEVRIPQLKANTAEKIKIRRVIDLLCNYLESWTYNGKNGLPQNRDSSSFLANILMDSVDKEMESCGYQYFRYMDDIRIVCTTHLKARQALKLLSESLRKVGLNLNSAKTKIGRLNDIEIKNSFINLDRDLESIDQMWKSKSLTLIKKSIPYLKKYTLTQIAKNAAGDRGFRFAIKRIEGVVSCDELDVPKNFFDEITDKVIEELNTNPTATDSFVKYLSFVSLSLEQENKLIDFLCDGEQAIYSWQNYRIWSLLILRNVKSEKLLTLAKDFLQSPTHKPANEASKILYLGKFGTKVCRQNIALKFPEIKSTWLQRLALIALKELSYNDGISKIANYSKSSTKGTYKRVYNNPAFAAYILPPEKTNYADLYDEVSIYD